MWVRTIRSKRESVKAAGRSGDDLSRSWTPPRLAIEPALLLGQQGAGLEMHEEMGEAHLGPRTFGLGDRGAHAGLVGPSVGEESTELRLGFQEPAARGT